MRQVDRANFLRPALRLEISGRHMFLACVPKSAATLLKNLIGSCHAMRDSSGRALNRRHEDHKELREFSVEREESLCKMSSLIRSSAQKCRVKGRRQVTLPYLLDSVVLYTNSGAVRIHTPVQMVSHA